MLTVESIMISSSNGVGANIKYVRVGEEFRYALAGGVIEHKQLVKENETPISAGFFSLLNDFFFLHNMPSTSLHLGPHADDVELLRAIFIKS